MNEDEILEDLKSFEHEGATKLSPVHFARLLKIAPQMVYYYIRNKVIETETCICGRTVLDVQTSTDRIKERQARRHKVV